MFNVTQLLEKQLGSDYFIFNPVKSNRKEKELQKTRDVQPACHSTNTVFLSEKLTMIGKEMDFLQTKPTPWSHSLFICLFTYLFLFTVKEIRKEMGMRRGVSRPLEGRRSEIQTRTASRPSGMNLQLEWEREEAEAAARRARGRAGPPFGRGGQV